ncbi:MAG: efflux RND transporter periplasmic adaptor subunit [Proteobacteria bacterium]|nr:efflux RND transporter periplasmic adaptor subunit [Pseudomonadota bacterium]
MAASRTLKLVLPVVFLVGAVMVSITMMQSAPRAHIAPSEPPALLVAVNTANREPVNFIVSTQGTVTPRTQTTLVSEVSGQIVEVSPAFVSGGFFNQGDVLLRIDPRNYQSSLKRAQADVARAQTQVATESALAGYAMEDWQRLRELSVRETGKPSDLTLRKPQMQEAFAELAAKEADLEKATEDLNRTVIRAPYDGMVRDKLADVGQFVNPGTQLARTFAVDRVEVRLPITQQDLKYLDLRGLRDGRELKSLLTADIGGRSFTWPATVVRSEGVFNENTRIVYVVAVVNDPYQLSRKGDQDIEPLRVGTFVEARIEGKDGGDLFVIPRHALTRGTTLWIVDEESRIQPKEVAIVRTDERFAYISEGISDGDRYVTIPVDQPLPGLKVRYDG